MDIGKPGPKDASVVLTVHVTQHEHGDGTSTYGFPWTITWNDGTQTPVRHIGPQLNDLGKEFAIRISRIFAEDAKRRRQP